MNFQPTTTDLQSLADKLNRAAEGEIVELSPQEAVRYGFTDEAAEEDNAHQG